MTETFHRYANTGLGEWIPDEGASLIDVPPHPDRSPSPAPAADPALVRTRGTERSAQRTAQHSAQHAAQPAAERALAGHPEGAAAPKRRVEDAPAPWLQGLDGGDRAKAAPKRGWRRFVHGATGGRINPGPSAAELRNARVLEAISTPLRGDYRIAVMSLKGGVGKTTTTVALGSVLADTRGDRVIAIDANPDFGTLAQRVAAPGDATIRDLLEAGDTSRYAQIRSFTTQGRSRLEVIGSERDPAVSESFSEDDYRRAVDILQHHYNVILTDCGTGLMHSAMAGVLDLANTIVLVSSPALDAVQSAAATLDWLSLHGYERLAANAVVAVSAGQGPAAKSGSVAADAVKYFAARTRAVHVIPHDPHLAEGGVVDLERVHPRTLDAYRALAATIAGDFGGWHKHAR